MAVSSTKRVTFGGEGSLVKERTFEIEPEIQGRFTSTRDFQTRERVKMLGAEKYRSEIQAIFHNTVKLCRKGKSVDRPEEQGRERARLILLIPDEEIDGERRLSRLYKKYKP